MREHSDAKRERSNPRHQGAGVQDMHVLAIGLDTERGTPLLLVAEQTGRRRALPLSIGIAEAFAIQLALRGIRPPRPPTHQLIAEVITALGTQLDHVEITALRDNIFHADLVFTADLRISARPSDAIALALQTSRPIRATDELLDHVGTTAFTLDPTVADGGEAEITRFRQELDRIDPDDFTPG
jgi:bifunctional DNase/RNase